jgi:hypothetical protein
MGPTDTAFFKGNGLSCRGADAASVMNDKLRAPNKICRVFEQP